MSVDPYMRGRMNDAKSYAPPFEVGKAMLRRGDRRGDRVDGRLADPGDIVLHSFGWREYAVIDATARDKSGHHAWRRQARTWAYWG